MEELRNHSKYTRDRLNREVEFLVDQIKIIDHAAMREEEKMEDLKFKCQMFRYFYLFCLFFTDFLLLFLLLFTKSLALVILIRMIRKECWVSLEEKSKVFTQMLSETTMLISILYKCLHLWVHFLHNSGYSLYNP